MSIFCKTSGNKSAEIYKIRILRPLSFQVTPWRENLLLVRPRKDLWTLLGISGRKINFSKHFLSSKPYCKIDIFTFLIFYVFEIYIFMLFGKHLRTQNYLKVRYAPPERIDLASGTSLWSFYNPGGLILPFCGPQGYTREHKSTQDRINNHNNHHNIMRITGTFLL